MSDLRAIGSRAFVHIETHTTKLGDKAWEGKLCGFSQDSRAYRIYNPAKGTVVESRKVTFLETPPYSHLPTKGLDYVHDDEEAYARDPIIFDNKEEVASAQVEHLHARIRDMTRENEDKRLAYRASSHGTDGTPLPRAIGASSPGADGTSSPGAIGASSPRANGTSSSGATGASSPEVDESTPPTSPGVAPAAHKLRVTRASTRANPNTEDICYGALTDYQLREIRTLMPKKGPP